MTELKAKPDACAAPRSGSAEAIVLEHLVKSFPEAYGLSAWLKNRFAPPRRTVLRDISFSVQRGEFFGLLGPNGAGKTTLLKTLATLTLPDSGRVVVDGVDLVARPEDARARIGLCTSEERSFYYRLSARQNLTFFGTLLGLEGANLAGRIHDVVALVDLGADIDRPFKNYSSGMRQRLAIARSLLGDPEILLFDEPTRSVDPTHAESIRRFIRDVLVKTRGKTVVLATNVLEEAWNLCDRIAVLREGKVVAVGPPRALGAHVMGRAAYSIVVDRADERLLAALRAIPGVASVEARPQSGNVLLEIELEDARPLTELLRVLGSGAASVFEFRPNDPRPIDVFDGLTRSDDAP